MCAPRSPYKIPPVRRALEGSARYTCPHTYSAYVGGSTGALPAGPHRLWHDTFQQTCSRTPCRAVPEHTNLLATCKFNHAGLLDCLTVRTFNGRPFFNKMSSHVYTFYFFLLKLLKTVLCARCLPRIVQTLTKELFVSFDRKQSSYAP